MSSDPSCASYIAAALTTSRTAHVFAYPGDPIIDLMEGLRAGDVDVVLARREGTAAFMAEGLALATGEPGVCLSTLGPGSTALLNGVAAATADRAPVIAISGQIESGKEDYFTHQVVDHGRLYASVTKWAGRIHSESVDVVMRKAFRIATAERPGAVHLTLPSEVSGQPAPATGFTPPPAYPVATGTVVRHPDAASPQEMLRGSRRPIILAGTGASRAGAGAPLAPLAQFAETVGAPVVVSPMAKGVLPEDHPLFAGVLDMACNQVVWQFLDRADLIIAVGFDGVELIKPWALTTPVLHVDAVPNCDQIYASPCECLGDIGGSLGWLAAEFVGEPRWEPAEIRSHREALRSAYYEGRVNGRLNPTDVIDIVQAAVPDDAIATTDVGSHKLLVGQGWRARAPRTVLMTNGLSSMGFGVPAAIAAQLAFPQRPVVALVGDGGFAMTATEIRLAAARSLPIVFVVLADQSLNRIELKQLARQIPSTATRIEEMDLVSLASALSCDGVRVDTPAELEKALAGRSELTRPLVVDARIDPSQYQSQF